MLFDSARMGEEAEMLVAGCRLQWKVQPDFKIR